jgi:hypothetical protein
MLTEVIPNVLCIVLPEHNVVIALLSLVYVAYNISQSRFLCRFYSTFMFCYVSIIDFSYILSNALEPTAVFKIMELFRLFLPVLLTVFSFCLYAYIARPNYVTYLK